MANIHDLGLRGAWFSVGSVLLEIWQFNPMRPTQLMPEKIGMGLKSADLALLV
jgi:hypothetical protein